jgi:hypothetical protein
MTLYGDIYQVDGVTIQTSYFDEVRRLSGNPRIETLSDEALTSARIGASERVERKTRREDVSHNPNEVELYNLMSKAVNYFSSAEIMSPYNDKQESRKTNIIEAEKICKEIMDFESENDVTVENIDPIVVSEYSTPTLASDGVGEGRFSVTDYGGSGGLTRRSGYGEL